MTHDAGPGREESADVLIVGGGVVGVAAAIAAADHGASVIVADWGRDAGSAANAGSLHVQLQSRFLRLFPDQAPNVEASLPLYVQAVAEWERLDAAHGPFELCRDGGLMVAETDEQLGFLDRKAARERGRGLDVDILGRAELAVLAPYLGEQVVGAELCRDEGKVNPLIANARLRAAAKARGVRLRHDRIDRLERRGGRALAVGAGRYRADRVVIAAAWGAAALSAGIGLALPVRAEPLHMNITEPGRYTLRHLVQHAERPITLKQFRAGQIVIGGGWPARPGAAGGAPGVLGPSLLGNVALAARLAPGIGGLRVLRSWAGLNTTADGKSILGPVPGADWAVVAVPGDAGYTLGPLCGRAAAALACGHDPPFDPAPFAPGRFSRPAAARDC